MTTLQETTNVHMQSPCLQGEGKFFLGAYWRRARRKRLYPKYCATVFRKLGVEIGLAR